MTHNTREVEELREIISKKHGGLGLCDYMFENTVVPFIHQQLQKAREEERERYKKYLKYHYENYGIESLRELITTPLDHSELDHLPDRPLNSERE